MRISSKIKHIMVNMDYLHISLVINKRLLKIEDSIFEKMRTLALIQNHL